MRFQTLSLCMSADVKNVHGYSCLCLTRALNPLIIPNIKMYILSTILYIFIISIYHTSE